MKALIINEFKKLFSKKKTYITIIAFILLIFVIAFGTYKNMKNEKEYNNPKNRIAQNEQRIKDINKELEKSSMPDNKKKQMQLEIEQMEQENDELKSEITSDTDWKKALQTKNERLKKSKDGQQIESNDDSDYKDSENQSNDDSSEIDNEIKLNNYLINNNIKPQGTYDFNAYSCMKQIISVLGAIFIAIGVAIFASDIVSGEFIPPTMKVLLIQPVSRAKVLFSKYITSLISVIILIIGIEMLSFLIIGGIFGFGSSAYPNFIGLKYASNKNGSNALKLIANSGVMIPQWKFLMYSLLLQLLFIIAVFSFTFLLSVIFKSSMISMAVNIVFVIFLSIFMSFPAINKIAAYIFLIYGRTSEILTGDMMTNMQNPKLTISFSIIIMCVWTIVSYILSHIIFKKRDILI